MDNIGKGPNHPPQMPQMKVDIGQQPDLTCDSCGSIFFREDTFFIKKISALVSPTGEAGLAPLGPLFSCARCGHINEEFIPPAMRNKAPSAPVQKESNRPNLTIID